MAYQRNITLRIHHIDLESSTALEVGWVSENAVNDPSIVTASRTESSQVPSVEYSDTDLSDLVLRVFESLTVQAYKNNVRIVC
ncbi:hypothetical protein LTR01_008677 [Friedmanniomyces endolithicus]|nr:hypothetical protein LTR01_008677 [Friedmanniomyces endolithicus]